MILKTALNLNTQNPYKYSNSNQLKPQKTITIQKSYGFPENLNPVHFGLKIPPNLPGDWRGKLPNEVDKFIDYEQLKGIIPKTLDPSKEVYGAFQRSYKDNIDLKERDLSGLNFSKSNLYAADLSKSTLLGVNFEDASLFAAKFNNVTIGKNSQKAKDAVFRCSDLGDAEFRNVKVESAVNMEKANIMGADFSGTQGTYLNLRNAFYNDYTILPDGMTPESKKMIKIEPGADLSKNALCKYGIGGDPISLDNAKFRKVNFVKVNFNEASAKCIDFKDAYLKQCTMNKTDLTRSYFNATEIEDTSMRKAKLKQANFDHANLIDVDMSETDLRGAILTWKTATNVNLHGATYDDVTEFHDNFSPEAHGMIKVKTNWSSYGYKKNKD